MNNLILVTDWEKVEKDDFYVSDKWLKDNHCFDKKEVEKINELQKEGNLYEAFIVRATDYAIYHQMDADQVLINEDMDIIVHCEGQVINNDHEDRTEYEG